MADRSALGTIGLLLGAATLAVTMVATLVVTEHITGRLHLDDSLSAVSVPAAMR